MNELVGHLLFTFAEGRVQNVDFAVESDVFFCFQIMLQHLGENFCRSLDFDRESGIKHTMRTFERVFEFCDPELFEHVSSDLHIQPEFYAFRWTTLMLTQEFLVPEVLRVWDFLFSYGPELSSSIYYTAVAMLIFARERLLEMPSMTVALPFLQQYQCDDVSEVLDVALKLIETYGFSKIHELKQEAAVDEELQPVAKTPEASEWADHAMAKVSRFFKNIFPK
jgi:hypothetical protein